MGTKDEFDLRYSDLEKTIEKIFSLQTLFLKVFEVSFKTKEKQEIIFKGQHYIYMVNSFGLQQYSFKASII